MPITGRSRYAGLSMSETATAELTKRLIGDGTMTKDQEEQLQLVGLAEDDANYLRARRVLDQVMPSVGLHCHPLKLIVTQTKCRYCVTPLF